MEHEVIYLGRAGSGATTRHCSCGEEPKPKVNLVNEFVVAPEARVESGTTDTKED
jgi:hypothetical protein